MSDKEVKPLVSVIVLTYNQAKTIGRTLDSVLAQEAEFPYEIIIGDDASTDGTRAICKEYADRFPDIVRLMPEAPNKGVVDNYFDCLLEARGEYISDCSGDDYWLDTAKLALEVGALENALDAVVAYSDWLVVDSETGDSVQASTLPAYRRVDEDTRPLLVKVLDHVDALPYNLSASTYRRDALMAVYNDRTDAVRNVRFGCEDVPVMAALASRGRAVRVPAVTFAYVEERESVSHSRSAVREARFYVKSLYASRFLADYYGIPLGELCNVYTSKLKFISGTAFRTDDRELADEVEKIVASWPLRPDFKTTLRRKLAKSPFGNLLRRICEKFCIFAV